MGGYDALTVPVGTSRTGGMEQRGATRGAPMQMFIQTRGRTVDYRFLGQAPDRPWWHDYDNHTILEKPTILVRSTDAGWEVYLGGIASGRTDLAGRAIRFTLVIADGQPADAERVLPLLCVGLAGAIGEGGGLQNALDRAFDETFVERILATPGLERSGEVESRLADVVARVGVGRDAPGAFDAAGGTWLGSARDAAARSSFLAHAAAIMGSRTRGRALLLNMVRGVADAADLTESEQWAAGCVILAASPREDIEGLVRLPGPEPSPPPPPDQGTLIAVASFAGFVGAFAGAFAKRLGDEVGKASAEAAIQATRQLRTALLKRARYTKQTIEIRGKAHHVLVTRGLTELPAEALQQLEQMDFNLDQGSLRWDAKAGRWRLRRRPWWRRSLSGRHS